MSYNSCMGMAPPPSQQNSRVTKKEEESDAFMRAPDKEIAGYISDIGVPFSAAELHQPNPLKIQHVFQRFAELLMNATHDTFGTAMTVAAKDVGQGYMKLLVECGVHGFSSQDLQKPTYERLSKNFSYIMNFLRLRESQTGIMDNHFNLAETSKARIETLYMENQKIKAILEAVKTLMNVMEQGTKGKVALNQKLIQQEEAFLTQ